jgi:hypothetical protein
MVELSGTPDAVAALDARPIRPVSFGDGWELTSEARDRIARTIKTALTQQQAAALVLKSENGVYPAWVSLEAWVTHKEKNFRRKIEITIDHRPYNRHPVIYTVRVDDRQTFRGLTQLDERQITEWTRYALCRGPKPASIAGPLSRFLRVFGLLVAAIHPDYNPAQQRIRERVLGLPELVALIICGIGVFGVYESSFRGMSGLLIGGIGTAALAVVLGFRNRARHYDYIAPQPAENPRHLAHIDAWHAVVIGLGPEADALKERLLAGLDELKPSQISIKAEEYGYRMPNNFELRERLVIERRQAQVHVHLYSVGDDLFVGWDARLNWARWAESTPVATRSVGLSRVRFREIRPSWYVPEQSDLVDLDSLSSVVHALVTASLNALMRERGLAQDVDFEVGRGRREDALEARSAWPERRNKRERDSGAIFSRLPARRSTGDVNLLRPDSIAARSPAALPARASVLLPGVGVLLCGLALAVDPLSLHLLYELPPHLRTVYYPLIYLPFAMAIGLGANLYAGVRGSHALLIVATLMALSIGAVVLYMFLFAGIFGSAWATSMGRALVYQIGANAAKDVAYLVVLALWIERFRDWTACFAVLAAWTGFRALAFLAIQAGGLQSSRAILVVFATEIFMLTCTGIVFDGAGSSLVARLPFLRSPPTGKGTAPDHSNRIHVVNLKAVAICVGAFFVVVGAAVILQSEQLPSGRPGMLGPGDFPLLLGYALVLLGVGIGIMKSPLRAQMTAGDARTAVRLTIAMISFAVLLPRFGAVPAVAALAAITTVSSSNKARVAAVVVLGIAAVVIAVSALQLPIPLLRSGGF